MSKAARERTPEALRRQAKGGDADARAELIRRRGNLQGAVVPEWEKALRGQVVDDWEVW